MPRLDQRRRGPLRRPSEPGAIRNAFHALNVLRAKHGGQLEDTPENREQLVAAAKRFFAERHAAQAAKEASRAAR